jgi:hypothetical protein
MPNQINILDAPSNANCGTSFTFTVNGIINVIGGCSISIEKVNTDDTNYYFLRGTDPRKFIHSVSLPFNCTRVGQGFTIVFNISLNSLDGVGGILEFKATLKDSTGTVTSNIEGTNSFINLICP